METKEGLWRIPEELVGRTDTPWRGGTHYRMVVNLQKFVVRLLTAKTLRVVCILALLTLLIGNSACQVLGKRDGPASGPITGSSGGPTGGTTGGTAGGPSSGSTSGPGGGSTAGPSGGPTSGQAAGSTTGPTTGSSSGSSGPASGSPGGSTAGPISGSTPGSTGGSTAGPTTGSSGGSSTGPTTPSTADPVAALEKLYDSKSFYTDYVKHLEALASEYSDTGIVRMTSIGKSVEGRDIHAVILGTEGASTRITINATHHSDEYINTMLVLNQIEHILRLYRDGGEFDGISVRQLLAKSEIYFIPLVNPDGLEIFIRYLETGEIKEGFTTADLLVGVNANNVNLNRNYDANFRPNVQRSGDHAFCEPETQTMRDMHSRIDFDYSVAYHSVGNVIFWNYGQTGELYDKTLEIAKLLRAVTGYTLDMQPATQSTYIAGTADFGGYKDWLLLNGKAAVTIETARSGTGDGKVPWSAYADIWRQNRDVPLSLVSYFYRQRNVLVEGEVATANLRIGGRIYPDEVILYDGKSYIQEGLFQILLQGGETDGMVRGMSGKTMVLDVTDSQEFVMIDGVKYVNLKALAGSRYDVGWEGETRTVTVAKRASGPG